MIRTALLLSLVSTLHAEVHLDIEGYGKSLGGWNAKGKSACDYDLSGAGYRTYKPEITPTPDGGIFASVRIDHRRGWLASDDHAVLEVTIDKNGSIVSAQSNLALQGKTISSDVIRTGGSVGLGVPGVGPAVKVGADLTADLSSKLLREKVVEPGRVNFPSAVRHNYNLIFQAIRTGPDAAPQPAAAKPDEGKAQEAKPLETKPAEVKPAEVKPAEVKPTEAKPAETKPAEVKPAEGQPVEPKKEETPPPASPKPAPTAAKLEVKPVGETQELKK